MNQTIRYSANIVSASDGIPNKVYKAFSASNRKKYLSLLNNSFISDEVLTIYKTILILSHWKNGKPQKLINSYQPIALAFLGCKNMEHILFKRILDYIMTSHLSSYRHIGFITSTGC